MKYIDNNGWASIVQLTVKNGEVSEIIIEDFDKNNVKRSDNVSANEQLKKDIGTIYPEIVTNFKNQFMHIFQTKKYIKSNVRF